MTKPRALAQALEAIDIDVMNLHAKIRGILNDVYNSSTYDEPSEPQSETRYGWCPVCGAPGYIRERKLIDGMDTCLNGHVYPTERALKTKPEIEG